MLRTREHEWAHFRQHISTQYGLFLHRLSALKEVAVGHFFRELDAAGLQYRPRPFRVLLFEPDYAEHPMVRTALFLWHVAEVISSCLWSKSARMDYLIRHWSALTEIAQHPGARILPFEGKVAGIQTSRTPASLSTEHGRFKIQDLVEGYAKFREFWHVAQIFGKQEARKHLDGTWIGTYGGASLHVSKRLGLEREHPLVGALLEISMAAFLDPLVNSDLGTIVWENIHPAMLFERAVEALASRGAPYPSGWEDSYTEAAGVLMKDAPQSMALDDWIERSRKYLFPLETLAFSQCENLHEYIWQYQIGTFVEGLDLRRRCPGAYYLHQSKVDEAARAKLKLIGVPPILLNPEGIFFTHSAERSPDIAFALAASNIVLRAAHEISNEGSLKHTARHAIRLSKEIRRISPADEIDIKGIFIEALGTTVGAKLRKLTGGIIE